MSSPLRRRRQCEHCKVQTFNPECLNCGGKLRPVTVKPLPSPEHVAAARTL